MKGIDLTPSARDQEYLDECLRLFKQKTSGLNRTETQAFTEKIQLRMSCWDVIYWFRMNNYPALDPLNAENLHY